ncbi:hypothetical protein FE634_21675 [Nocardioides dongxiaopingii]|uniref:hypothetical protein n=1 Tax=Nocardioides sp. S-1144 TaxID=2582905 RepID=UPI0011632E04|nr:hypothetical protein [Nocardioides sp. S-1144]QDH10838.1 hypothetical protein FE634_21675 [Nocardioides sp. S-1144]
MRPFKRDRPAGPDSVRDAQEVVGLYGDPDTTWGICVEVRLLAPLEADDVARRVADLCAREPHLGAPPPVSGHDTAAWAAARAEVAAAPYGPGAPLVRLALTADGTGLVVGAHHGAVDGLGLLAVAGAALGRDLRTRARGIGDRAAPHGFLASSLRRLGEAVVDPPSRFPGVGDATSAAEDLTAVTRPRVARGTSDLARAVLAAHDDAPTRDRRRSVVVIGASRRTTDLPTADRQTAYLRLRVGPGHDRTALGPLIASLRPEPDFPETSAKGAGPVVARLLRKRLGSTAILSNLGLVEADGVASLAMYPATSGPRAVAVGLASTDTTTTLSLRTRRRELDAQEHAGLLAAIADRFFA